jgi:TctA family transporter
MAVFSQQSIIYMFIGVGFGLLIGFLPGLGGIMAMTLMLPFTFGIEPAAGLALLFGAHVATNFGDSTSSILFNVPGAAKSVTACFDGYPMTQRGDGARALGAAAMASLVGGVFGAVCLTISLPFMRAIMLALGPSEYFMLALWGLTVIAIFSDGSVLKGLVAAGFGLLLAFIGMDPVTGTARYTFGIVSLIDGIEFPVAVIGLFAISQMMKLYVKGGSIVERELVADKGSALDGIKDTLRHWRLVLSSSALGLFIGFLPGVGATIGSIAAYGHAVQSSKRPESFGKGAVEGVIAPQATNGANEGGGLMPTLAFGVPGGESMAILLIAFVNMGISPGREMMTTHLSLVFSMVWMIVIANFLATGFGLLSAKYFTKLTVLPGTVLIPVILAFCFVGAYAVRGRVTDIFVAVIFGFIGFYMDKYGYSRADLVIGLVLGLMLERYLHISLTLYGGTFFVTRPVTLALLIFVVFTLVYPFVQRHFKAAKRGGVRT